MLVNGTEQSGRQSDDAAPRGVAERPPSARSAEPPPSAKREAPAPKARPISPVLTFGVALMKTTERHDLKHNEVADTLQEAYLQLDGIGRPS